MASTNAFLVVVQKASGVKNADGMLGTSDPYFKITTPTAPAMLNVQSPVIQGSCDPVWDLALLVVIPAASQALVQVNVFDSDAGAIVDGSDVSSFCSGRVYV
jgi:Ca2+-dependent lipid-binding protein